MVSPGVVGEHRYHRGRVDSGVEHKNHYGNVGGVVHRRLRGSKERVGG